MFLTKRVKISITTTLLTISLFTFPFVDDRLKIYFLSGLVLGSYLLSVWSIYQDLEGFEFITLFVLPTLLTLSFGLFINQYKPITEVRLILAFVYGVVLYTNLLAENIFNVSAERNIPLLRAARTVGYLVTLFVAFSFFSLLFGLGLPWWILCSVAFIVGGLLFSQALWQIELEGTLSRELVINSLVAGILVGQMAAGLSFWPLDPPKIGLAMTALVYVLLGIMQHMIKKDLTRRAAIEYIFVGFSVFFLLFVTTNWGI